jgi:hypothetical protein
MLSYARSQDSDLPPGGRRNGFGLALVAVMGASSYTFACAARNQNLHSWIDCHIRVFEFLEGVPRLIMYDSVPGNRIQVMCPISLCGRSLREEVWTLAAALSEGT